MAFDPDPSAIMAGLSGLALVGLGFAVFTIRPLRPSAFAFATFATLWGLQISAANLGRMHLEASTAWTFAFLVPLILLYVPLLFFVAEFPTPSGALARRRAWWLAVAAPGLLLLTLLATAPSLFVRGTVPMPGWQGPLYWPTTLWNSVYVFVVALAVSAWKLRVAEAGPQREQIALVTAAFVLYVSYQATFGVRQLLAWAIWVDLFGSAVVVALVAGAVAGFVLVIGVAVWASRQRDLPWRDLVMAAAVVPFAVGLAEAFLQRFAVPLWFDTQGLWRIGMVGLFLYTIARHRLFDAELRLRAMTPYIAYGVSVFVFAGVVVTLAWDRLADIPLMRAGVLLGVAAVCAPAGRLGQLAITRGAPRFDEPEYIYRRKMDVYRAAYEESRASGMRDPTDLRFLADLRRRLGISEEEHRVLLVLLDSQGRRGPRGEATVPPQKQRFRVERELGRGSYGRAVLAHDEVLDRRVVLKQPFMALFADGAGREEFMREARIVAKILHTNVVMIYEVLTDHDPPSLVFEYVDGGSLQGLLQQKGRLETAQAVGVAVDVLGGLRRVHKEGIVHRDLKPANVLLTKDGTAKVGDFGVAHAPATLSTAATMVATQAQPGSIAYMSPEQARSDPVDVRSDLYAVGVILYEMLTGRLPYALAGLRAPEAKARIQTTPPDVEASDVPARLRRVLAKALAKDPADRYQTANQMWLDLRTVARSILGEEPVNG